MAPISSSGRFRMVVKGDTRASRAKPSERPGETHSHQGRHAVRGFVEIITIWGIDIKLVQE
jgi:hypothetical protein